MMLQEVQELMAKQRSISKFVADQWALLELIKLTDKHWLKAYYDLVNSIEDTYATAADQGRSLVDSELKFIELQLIEMARMLKSSIEMDQ